MPAGDVETYYEDEQWHNRVQGTTQVISSDETKEEAVDIGRDIARELNVEHLIRNKSGRITVRRSYHKDSRRSTLSEPAGS
jgi:Uncharacterized protein conserved in bacteria (DUF2188)